MALLLKLALGIDWISERLGRIAAFTVLAAALGAVIVSHIWKFTPFWTLIFVAGRMAIPKELYESVGVAPW